MARRLPESKRKARAAGRKPTRSSDPAPSRTHSSATISETIGGAIAAAAGGDTVFVFDGSYPEMVTIGPALTGLSLLGRDPKKTIINAANKANGIVDEANGVTINGFTITKANHEGILVEGSTAASCSMGACTPGDQITGVTISNNIVLSNDQQLDTKTSPPTCPGVPGVPDFDAEDCGEAVHLDGVAFSTVSNNVIQKNAGGILLTDENNSNHDNLVNGNDVEDNIPDCGITLPSHPPAGSDLNIGDASFGVFRDTVTDNISKNNGAAGVGVFTPTPGTSSHNHLILANELIGNINPGVIFHSHAPGQNLTGTEVVGNLIERNGAEPDPGPGESDGPAVPTGIEVYADVTALPIDAHILGNTITDETNDIWIGAPSWANCGGAPTPCYNASVYLNNLLGGQTGVNNVGSGADVAVGAANNFWGCRNGPGASGCSKAAGNVSTTPFLTKSVKFP
jgi:hypothetical protein